MGYNYDTIEDLLNEPFKLGEDTSKSITRTTYNSGDWYGHRFDNTPNYFYMNGE